MWTQKDKLKHQVQMLKDTVNNNPFTQMDYEIKTYKYNKWVVLEGLKCLVMAIVTGSLICLFVKYC